jgi:hypothetical protein
MAHVFSFTTAAAADSTAPSLTSAVPGSTATGVARNANIQLTFSEPMDKAATQAAFSITAPAGYSTGAFSWSADGKTMTFNPGPNFNYGEAILWRVTTAAKDLAGNALAQQISRGFLVIRQGTMILDSVAAVDGAYGATLQASSYSVARFTGFGDSSTFISTDTAGWKLSSQLAFGVGDDWANRATRGSRTQFRIRMPTEASDNTTADALKMRSGNSLLTTCTRTALGASGSSCKPYLVVTYESP